MQRFVLRFLMFLFIGALLAGVTSVPVAFLVSKKIHSSQAFILDTNKRFIFTGDSHIKSAIDDALFPEAVNIAAGSEAYLYSYIKTKKLLEHNKQIKAVIAGFSYHNFSAFTDPWLSSDYYLPFRIPKYFYAIPAEDQWKLFTINPPGFIKGYIRIMLSSYFLFGNNYKTLEGLAWGGYAPFGRNVVQHQLQQPIESYRTNGSLADVQIEYVNKLDELCRKHNARLILLGTPVHPYRIQRVTADTTNLAEIYRTHFSSLTFYNYGMLALPDSCFGDLKHLSQPGGVLFTKLIRGRLLKEFGVKQY